MGNAACAREVGLEDLCVGRGAGLFSPPNTEYVTFSFDYKLDDIFFSLDGEKREVSHQGFAIDSFNMRERSAPKWSTVKEYKPLRYGSEEYTPNAAQLRVGVSGRVLVCCPDEPVIPMQVMQPVCGFRVCTRGRPIYESVRTQTFTHTAQVVTSGIFFSLSLSVAGHGVVSGNMPVPVGSIFLCPRILLVLDSGDEVVLVEDKLGPLQAPQSFYTDFAIIDDGGRNVQLDLIFRHADLEDKDPSDQTSKGHMRTLRTCLQDYAAINNQVQPANISLGYSSLGAILPTASIHLQNLVVSEEPLLKRRANGKLNGPPAEPQPFDVWKEAAYMPQKETSSKILFEGADALDAARAIDVPEAPVLHPQLQPLPVATKVPSWPPAGPRGRSPSSRGGANSPAFASTAPRDLSFSSQRSAGLSDHGLQPPAKPLLADPSVDDFWYHMNYGEDIDETMGSEYQSEINGEFWLTKEKVDLKNVYFHCSSTWAQALSMCIIFRFSTTMDYLRLIETKATGGLRDSHIPTNGLVMGIERDPRHGSLTRMFLEHRNEILDDMVVCQCRPADLGQCVVHQEVYDSGDKITYRLTLLHSDGARQSAVLQTSTDVLEERNNDSNRHGSPYANHEEEPSSRFPIVPSRPDHHIIPVNRIFVYTSTAYEAPAEDDDEDQMTAQGSDGGDTAARRDRSSDHCFMSDTTSHFDDFQSAGGDFDHDDQVAFKPRVTPPMCRQDEPCNWRRPLIGSAVLLSRMEDPPFQCLPKSVSG